jgi:hypothetical protein
MLMVMACVSLTINVELIKDLIIFSTLCCKYGVSFLLLLHWVAYYCIQCIAYIVNISSWKLTFAHSGNERRVHMLRGIHGLSPVHRTGAQPFRCFAT